MAVFDPKTKKFYCECGCGEEVSSLNDWRNGHWMRQEENRKRHSEAMSGRVLSDEHRQAISKGAIRAHEEDPTYGERTAAGLTGLIRDEETNQHNREAQLKSYREDPTRAERQGKSLSGIVRDEEWCSNLSEAGLRAHRDDPGLADRHSEFMTGLVLGPHSEESKRQASESNLRYWAEHPRPCGEDSPHWKGGFEGRGYGYGWSAIREFILIRDGRTCQSCGSSENLCVHHIDGDTYNIDNCNLITVCSDCNKRATSRYEGDYWIDFYSRKVKEIILATGLVLA